MADTPPKDALKHLLDLPDEGGKPRDPNQGERQLAIALEWDGKEATAPKITASGRGELAEAILAFAFEQGVKVRKDADLAQLLSIVEIGQDIPPETFVAVAEILSYVYEVNAAADPRPSGDQNTSGDPQ